MFVSASHHRRRAHISSSGLSLIELLVVLMVLIAVAGIIVPNVTDLRFGFDGDRKTTSQIATEQSLLAVRVAVLGGSGKAGYWPDLGQREDALPQTIADLLRLPPALAASLQIYDPNTRLGWRGPYLLSSGAHYDANDAYGTTNDPAVLDGWGRPIVIQLPDAEHIRVVSKGGDGVLDTPPAVSMPTLATCGDDVILFLRVADTRS